MAAAPPQQPSRIAGNTESLRPSLYSSAGGPGGRRRQRHQVFHRPDQATARTDSRVTAGS